MRFHVVSLPHTETLQAYNQCAYTAKVRKFATMMNDLGHEVYLYSNGRNEASCSEHVQLIDAQELNDDFRDEAWWQEQNWPAVSWDASEPYWQKFNANVAAAIKARIEPGDFVCLITGWPHQPLIAQLPDNPIVEFGIGYEGILPSTFHVFESYTWMHTVYGKQGPSATDGHFYDGVIPNYFEVSEFPFADDHQDYYLFLSRMTPRKGYEIAIETTRRLGKKLVVAGTGGDRPQHDHVEYVGFADVAKRGELLSNAIGLFCPTLYLEPFGGVVCESLLCGKPVLTTDFGAFVETVQHGVDGFRCHTIGEFEDAAAQLQAWDVDAYAAIRERAQARWSTDVVAHRYEQYFDRLEGLRTRGGFYEARRPVLA